MPPLFLAFSATLCFAGASTLFTEYSRRISPLWMNAFKAYTAWLCFGITCLIFSIWMPPQLTTVIGLLLSGLLGLMIGDLFMLKAMAELGPSRMLMIFGLQPFLLGIGSYLLFSQSLTINKFIGVLLMLACLWTFSFENYRKNGHWQLKGLLHGFLAVALDAVGVLLTRWSFDHTPGISPIQVNFIRCCGACIGFLFVHYFSQKIEIKNIFLKQNTRDRFKILAGAIAGTYLSLMLYLTAVSKGHLSSLSAVTVTGPLFAAIFESLWHRRWPSPYLILGFIFFVAGFTAFLMP